MTSEILPSKFAMFRCLIAMAHADNNLEKDEQLYIQTMLEKFGLSDQEKKIIASDLHNPPALETLLPGITEPAYRASVVDFARIMAFKDGELERVEQAMLNKLHANAMSKVDMEELRINVRKNIESQLMSYDSTVEAERQTTGGWLASWVEKFIPND